MSDDATTCDSCGDTGPDLIEVHRIYVTWDLDGNPVDEQVQQETEVWCAVCRTQYPHEAPAGA